MFLAYFPFCTVKFYQVNKNDIFSPGIFNDTVDFNREFLCLLKISVGWF